MQNPHNIAEREFAHTQSPELEDIEIVNADPVDLWRWKPLILKIKALPSGRCIKRRSISQDDLDCLRSSATSLGVKLVVRSEPGATYLWNGNVSQAR